MSRLFQIYEDDLADLERILPQICDLARMHINNCGTNRCSLTNTMIRRVQNIVKDMRWNYGPHSQIESIAADGSEMHGGSSEAEATP